MVTTILFVYVSISSVQFSTQSCLTHCNPMDYSMPSFPVHHQVPEPTQTHVYHVSNAIQPSHPLASPSPPTFNLSQYQGLFQAVGSLHQMAKYYIGGLASASVLPMNIQDWFPLGLTWLDLFAVQGTLKSLLRHHSSKASILQHSAFFIVQLSHPYMITGKTITSTRQTSVGKVMSLLFNMLSRLVIALLPRSKCLLISWLQSPSAVIWEPPKISISLFPLFPHLFAMKWGDWMPWS